MIFSPEHIEQIQNVTKTQTRRVNRGVYRVGRDYSVQPRRCQKGIPNLRIVMDDIYFEAIRSIHQIISVENAKAEGGYTPEEYEEEFKRLYPKWDGIWRWVFRFHVKVVG